MNNSCYLPCCLFLGVLHPRFKGMFWDTMGPTSRFDAWNRLLP